MTVVLVVALSGVAIAQDSDLETSATTGTLELSEPMGDATTHTEAVEHVHTWTAEDPRLTGTATYTGAWHIYDPPAEDCDDPEAESGAYYEIVNDGGGWACAGVRAPIPGPDGATNVHVLALSGNGDYEGLYAYIMIDWGTDPFTFSALITPNQVPVVPVPLG
ncbi:MAG: hypothetical protein AB1Z67_02140 [Candidatus Limnocylindrales bacterium]